MSPYEVLGVPPSARPEDCRAAYRRLLSEHHPDRWATAPAEEQAHHARRLREVDAAWAALQRVERRPPGEPGPGSMAPRPDLDDDLREDVDLDDRPLTAAAPGCSLTILPVALLAASVGCFAVSVVLTITVLWQVALALAVASALSFLLVPFFVMLRGRR